MTEEIMTSTKEKKTFTQELKGTASEIISQIRKLIKEGNARRVKIVSKEGKVLFQTQLTVGVSGAALVTAMAPIISAIGMFALFLNDVKVVVERLPDEDSETDEYEVETEVEIIDEEEEEEEEDDDDQTDKTVGKKKDEDD